MKAMSNEQVIETAAERFESTLTALRRNDLTDAEKLQKAWETCYDLYPMLNDYSQGKAGGYHLVITFNEKTRREEIRPVFIPVVPPYAVLTK